MSSDNRYATIERRLLVQQRLSIGLGAVLALLILWVLFSRPRSQVAIQAGELTVKKLTVKDEAGRNRIVLWEDLITISDENSTERIQIYARKTPHAQIRMMDPRGNVMVGLSTNDNGSSLLGFYEKDGSSSLILGFDPTIGPVIRIFDSAGKRRFDIAVDHDQEAVGTFYDEADNPLVNIGVDQHKGLVRIFDSTGRALSAQP